METMSHGNAWDARGWSRPKRPIAQVVGSIGARQQILHHQRGRHHQEEELLRGGLTTGKSRGMVGAAKIGPMHGRSNFPSLPEPTLERGAREKAKPKTKRRPRRSRRAKVPARTNPCGSPPLCQRPQLGLQVRLQLHHRRTPNFDS